MNDRITSKTFAEGYQKLLSQVFNWPDFVSSPREMKIKECINLTLEIKNPCSNLFENKVRSVNKHYLAGELIWYFTGSNDLEFIEKYSKFWKKIANSDGTCNSAYGYLLFQDDKALNGKFETQWDWAMNSLITDKDSREAIIHFNKPWHFYIGNKDFPCTVYGNFHIRENKLYFSIYMRSSDSIRGTTFDIPFFMLLHQQAYWILRNVYEDLKIGSFTYTSNSQHIYEEHFELVENMLLNKFIEDSTPPIDSYLIESTILNQIKYNILNGNNIDHTNIAKSDLVKWIAYHAQNK
jgi:thymidylate synthase